LLPTRSNPAPCCPARTTWRRTFRSAATRSVTLFKWIGDKIAGDDLESDPIFSLLENKHGLALIEADDRVTACDAESSVAAALGIDAGSRILEIERTSYTAGGPIDYERLLYCADRLKFRMRLKRQR
jgi:GntR family transcriptional regulator